MRWQAAAALAAAAFAMGDAAAAAIAASGANPILDPEAAMAAIPAVTCIVFSDTHARGPIL